MPSSHRLGGTVPPPDAWRDLLAGYGWQEITRGSSPSAVFLLRREGSPDFFVKVGGEEHIHAETVRLQWLRRTGIGCPEVLACEEWHGRAWMLMTTVSGQDLASQPNLLPEEAVVITTQAIHSLHSLDVSACPFDSRLDVLLCEAYRRMKTGLVDESDFDEARKGRSAESLFLDLERLRPREDSLVVAHGDLTLGNIFSFKGSCWGLVDCASLGIADAHHDIAIVAREIAECFGCFWSDRFLAGVSNFADAATLEYYAMLDEFF
jgi:aminoglycoside 3'-phosphotransferase-2